MVWNELHVRVYVYVHVHVCVDRRGTKDDVAVNMHALMILGTCFM